MTRRAPRFHQRSLEPASQRLRKLLLRHLWRRFVHDHRVSRLRVGSRELKRIRFPDAWQASQVAAALEHFRGAGVLPELETRFDAELLVEFVPGEPLARFDASTAPALAAFFAGLHAGGARPSAVEDSGAIAQGLRDLAFLRDAGVVDATTARSLEDALARLAPERVWIGWDYTDAVPKNFVRRPDGRVIGVDVEALVPAGLQGIGIAKSLWRGDAGFRAGLLEGLRSQSAGALEPALPFIELCFQLRWLKNRCLKGSRIDTAGLVRFERAAEKN